MTLRARYTISIGSVVAVLFMWQACCDIFNVPITILPAPADIAYEFGKYAAYLGQHSLVTLIESISGFAIGLVVALILGTAMQVSSLVFAALRPLLLITQAVPKTAIAPLLVLWLGYDLAPKVAVAATISFFPILEEYYAGLRSVSTAHAELFMSLNASRYYTFVHLRVPSSIPYLLRGCRLGIIYSLLGALAAELAYPKEGLGYVLTLSENNHKMPLLFAAIVCSTLLAALCWSGFTFVERMIIRTCHLSMETEKT